MLINPRQLPAHHLVTVNCHNIPRTQDIGDKRREREIKKMLTQYMIPNNIDNTDIYLYNFHLVYVTLSLVMLAPHV